MRQAFRRATACCLAGATTIATVAAISPSASAATTAIDAPQRVCVPENPAVPTGPQFVSQRKLANWLYANALGGDTDSAFDPLAILAGTGGADEKFAEEVRPNSALGTPSAAERQQTLAAINGLRSGIRVMGKRPKSRLYRFYGSAGDDFDAIAWLNQNNPQSPLSIECNLDYQAQPPQSLPSATAAPAWSFERFRVRGVPDTLAVDRTNTAVFSGADGAAISFSYDGVKKVQAEAIQATIGYVIDLPADLSLVPYGEVSRNVTGTKGAATVYATDFFDFGAVGGWNYYGAAWGNILSFRPHFLINGKDDSRQVGLHFEDMPILDRDAINDYWVSGTDPATAVAFSFLFDFRGDAATFTETGTAPATNQDYFRLGSRFGATASLGFINSDVTVTDTWMYGFTGSVRRLNDFQASWTYHFDPVTKFFGLQLSYKKGVIEATAQPEQVWLVSLTGKY